jgi:hypothetical protein
MLRRLKPPLFFVQLYLALASKLTLTSCEILHVTYVQRTRRETEARRTDSRTTLKGNEDLINCFVSLADRETLK